MNSSSLRRYTVSHDHKLCLHVHILTRSKTLSTLHILTRSQILSTLAHFDTIPNFILTYTDSHDLKLYPPVHTLTRYLILSTCTNSYVILNTVRINTNLMIPKLFHTYTNSHRATN